MERRQMRVNTGTIFLLMIILVISITTLPIVTLAQEPESSPSDVLVYQVEHKHGIGSGKGKLCITSNGIEYRGFSENEARHGRTWRDEDIKRLEITKTELHVIAYEAASIPVVPRKVPFSHGGKSVKTGTEHEFEFRLLDGEITPELTVIFLKRFDRSIATTVIPKDSEESNKLIFEIPVFHRHRSGGESGVLRVYEQKIIFDAETEDHSRYWRYSDIRDIGRLGRDKFELATYEGQTGTDGKSYIFDLKRPMTEKEYDFLWTKLYENVDGLQPTLRKLEVDKDSDQENNNRSPSSMQHNRRRVTKD